MCLMCLEIIKENMTPREFWKNFKELEIPIDHQADLVKAIESTSEEYQKSLMNSALNYEE